MSFVIYPRYKDLYDGDIPTVQHLIKNIPTETIIGFACHINANKHLNQFDTKEDYNLFLKMIERLGSEHSIPTVTRLINYAEKNKKKAKQLQSFHCHKCCNYLKLLLQIFYMVT